MKKKANILIGFAALVFIIFSCQNPVITDGNNNTNDTTKTESGIVILGYSKQGVSDAVKSTANYSGMENVRSILISIADQTGNLVYDTKVLPVYNLNGSFVTESISFQAGTYTIEKFMVVDDKQQVIFAAPYKDSNLANQYAGSLTPLPFSFTITKDTATTVKPDVLTVSGSTALDFGYSSFGFNVIDLVVKKQIEKDVRDNDIETTEYDRDGKIILFSFYDPAGNSWIDKYEYDAAGRLIRKYECDYDNPTQETGNTELFEYDLEGKLIKRKQAYNIPGAPVYITDYEYNPDGLLIRESEYSENDPGGYTTKYEYEYNLLNQVVKVSYFQNQTSSINTLRDYSLFEYDANGNEIVEKIYLPDNTLDLTVIKKYDLNNNYIERTTTDGTTGQILGKLLNEYDQAGRLVKRVDGQTNETLRVYTYEYF